MLLVYQKAFLIVACLHKVQTLLFLLFQHFHLKCLLYLLLSIHVVVYFDLNPHIVW